VGLLFIKPMVCGESVLFIRAMICGGTILFIKPAVCGGTSRFVLWRFSIFYRVSCGWVLFSGFVAVFLIRVACG